MITKKHILTGGVVLMVGVAFYLLIVDPVSAGIMALGVLGAGIYTQLMATLATENKPRTTPEEDWTGV